MLGETFDYTHSDRNGFRGQSGLTTHYNTNGISFGMGSIALLDMLAEVASQTLQSDPSMKSSSKATEKKVSHKLWELPEKVTPTKEKIVRKSVKQKKNQPVVNNHKLSIKRKKTGVNGGGKDYKGTTNISSLSANGLIKRFSEFDGDEMRRTFTFRCTFDLGHCRQQFSSFGSENKARQHMKDHLIQHVKARKLEVPSDLPISSKPKAGIDKRTLPEEDSIVKKKRKKNNTSIPNSYTVVSLGENTTNNNVTQEDLWMQGGCEVVAHEEETVTTSTVDDNVELYKPAEEGNNAFVLETKWMSDVGCVVTNQHTTEETNNVIVPETYCSEMIVVKLEEEEEEEASVYSEHNYMRQENDNLENNVCLRVIKEETGVDEFHPYSVKNETKAYHDGIKETTSTKSMLFNRLISKDKTTNHPTGGETMHKMVTTLILNDEGQHCQPLPFIGQEVDVNTSQLLDTTATSISFESKVPEHPVSVDVDTEEEGIFATESMSSKNKKNKGNSKLLGQSEAEKNLAIRLIESIKYKGSHPDSLECNICSPTRFFTALTTLISHYRSHAGIKPYECRLCGHVFTRQHSLNYHLLIHGNVTRFECADCGRKFRHPSHFKEHRRRHTGEAPYECLDCPLRFKTRNTYKRHLKTRHGKVLTTSGGLISLSDDEFGQVVTVARSPNLPKKPAPKGQTKQDGDEAFPLVGSDDSSGEDPQSSDQHNKTPGEHVKKPPSQDDLDKENAMTNVNNKNGTNKNKSLLSANEAFHDIVEEAMRQSDIIAFHIEPNNASLTQLTKEPNNNSGFDTSSNTETVQQNIGGNTLFITKITKNCNLSSTESTFGTKLKVPSLLSKINSMSENEQILPECTSVYNTLLKQSVTVNVTPVLTGNINTFNASYQRNILPRPRVKPANVSTELRIICPNAPTTAVMLVTGHPSAKSNG